VIPGNAGCDASARSRLGKRGQEPIAKWPKGCSALLVPDPFFQPCVDSTRRTPRMKLLCPSSAGECCRRSRQVRLAAKVLSGRKDLLFLNSSFLNTPSALPTAMSDDVNDVSAWKSPAQSCCGGPSGRNVIVKEWLRKNFRKTASIHGHFIIA